MLPIKLSLIGVRKMRAVATMSMGNIIVKKFLMVKIELCRVRYMSIMSIVVPNEASKAVREKVNISTKKAIRPTMRLLRLL